MKVMWFSKHDILPSQLQGLYDKLGTTDIEIVKDINPFSNVDDVINRYKMSGCDEMAIVAPWTIIELLCKRGIYPLWAEMENVPKKAAEVIVNGRGYRFKQWKRVKGIKIEFFDELNKGLVHN